MIGELTTVVDSIGDITSTASASQTDCTNWNSNISFPGGQYFKLYRYGKVVFLSAYFTVTANIGGYVTLCKIPRSFAPKYESEIPIGFYSTGVIQYGYLSTDGSFNSRHDITKGSPTIISTSWLIG